MSTTAKQIRENAEALIEAIIIPDDGFYGDVGFKKAARGKAFAELPRTLSAFDFCRGYRVIPGELIGPGWSAGTSQELDREINVFLRHADLSRGDVDYDLADWIADDQDLVTMAILANPFGVYWTIANFVNVWLAGRSSRVQSTSDERVWITTIPFMVRYERFA